MSHSTSLVYLTYFYPGFDLFIIQNVTSDPLPEARCFILTLLDGGLFFSNRTFFGLDVDVTIIRVFNDDLLPFIFLKGVVLGNLLNLFFRSFISFINRIYLLTALHELNHFLWVRFKPIYNLIETFEENVLVGLKVFAGHLFPALMSAL